MAGKRATEKALNPDRALPDDNEEIFAQARADKVPYKEAYRLAFPKSKLTDSSAVSAGFRLQRTAKVDARVDGILARRRRKIMETARKFDATREAVIAKAEAGWQISFEKGDVTGMSRHNNDIANFAREAYWHNKTEIKLEGPLEAILREVEDIGPVKPGSNGSAHQGGPTGSAPQDDHDEPEGTA